MRGSPRCGLSPEDGHPTRRRREQAEQHLEQRGLARPVRADDADDRPRRDRERAVGPDDAGRRATAATSSRTSAGAPPCPFTSHPARVAEPAELVDLPVDEARRPGGTVSVTSTTGTPACSAAARSCVGHGALGLAC